MNGQTDWETLAVLDQAILSGDTASVEADGLFDRRGELVAKIAEAAKSADELDELAARNRRITEWLLHCRRVALIESAALDQHLRFLERAGEPPTADRAIEVLG